jgi:hypothetical protein
MSYECFGRAYIGYRKCPIGTTPEKDPYMGSFRDKTFKPNKKEILAVFDNDSDAVNLEIVLHKVYDVANNPDFANLCNQLSNKVRAPHKLSKATRDKLSKLNSGPNNPNYGRKGPDHWHFGKKLPKEQREKISQGLKGRKLSAESIERIKNSNIESKDKKSLKFFWFNTLTNEVEDQKSIMYMSRKYQIQDRRLRRCSSGGKCHNTSGWIIKDNQKPSQD